MTRAILTLVRHGETSANLDGVWHGSTDTALTERGLAQAQRVGERIAREFSDAARIVSSPLQRTRLTAAAIGRALGRELELDPELTEYDLGSWEGRPYRELAMDEKLWDFMRSDPDFAPHGGESPRQVYERISGALLRLASAHRGERVVVVTHGGALSMALGGLLDGDYTRWHRVMENCAVSELVIEPEPALLRFNCTEHLEGI